MTVLHPEPQPTHDARDVDDRRAAVETHARSYYATPALKAPVWKVWIPLYFFVGGVAGSSAVLAAAASLRGRRLVPIVERGRVLALGAVATSTALLIGDLGRPGRFLNMLRVFRPTSPMSVGTWILTPLGASTFLAVIAGRRRGVIGRIGAAAGIASGVLGLPMSSYTAVLLANTAVPVWTQARRTLPWLFAASSVSSAGALLELLPTRPRDAAVLRRFSAVGRVAELALSLATERELGRGAAGRPLHHGTSGRLWSAAKVLGCTALALSLGSRRSTTARVLGAAAACAASLCLRFAVTQAGHASARDPRASLHRSRTRSAA